MLLPMLVLLAAMSEQTRQMHAAAHVGYTKRLCMPGGCLHAGAAAHPAALRLQACVHTGERLATVTATLQCYMVRAVWGLQCKGT